LFVYLRHGKLSSKCKPVPCHLSMVDKALQLPAAGGVAQLSQRFCLDLPDSLAGNGKVLPNLF